jgi:proteasome lid subunit RPN8/RPN11
VEVVPVRNAAGDASGDPRRDRHAFLLDPVEHLALERRVRAGRGRTVAAFHSHVDGPAELSLVDRESLVVDGAPVLPGTDHVVIGCAGGKAREIRSFRWDGSRFAPAAEVRFR